MSEPAWVPQEDRPLRTIFRNVTTRYLSVAAELGIGLLTLPFNLHHLGTEAYGLWMLTAGVTIHFSIESAKAANTSAPPIIKTSFFT